MKKSLLIIGIILLASLFLYSFYRTIYQINPGICDGCGQCTLQCPNNAIIYDEEIGQLQIDEDLCDGCGICVESCPQSAIFEVDGRCILFGVVSDSITGFPINNSIVFTDTINAIMGMWGKYWLVLRSGNYDLYCTAENYEEKCIYGLELDENEIRRINFSLNSTTISANENEINPEFKMTNYPNPFNSTTKFRFQTLDFKENESTEIVIYNIKGQKIRKYLISNNQSSITWDGTGQSNNPVSSGIYYYKLNIPNSPVKKMLLMK